MFDLVTADSSSNTSVCDHNKSAELLVESHSSVSTQSSSLNLTSHEPSFAPPVNRESSNSGADTGENENGAISAYTSSELGAQSPQPPTSTNSTEDGHQILFYVKALYDYTASIEEEFDFRVGDIIAVTHTPEDGWWIGELLDEKRRQRGRHVFPSNFVSLCDGNKDS
ncbi:hypothetical protein C0993_011703 [Termitomyces sp. T159_Od127]|nr:hypothetical protein C0993_011703 [Termitomyces sp. T159_Od127]